MWGRCVNDPVLCSQGWVAELIQAGGEDVIIALTTIRNKIWQKGEWQIPLTQSLAVSYTHLTLPTS